MIKVICEECKEGVEPTEINAPAFEARCPKCGEWFCYADDEYRVDTHKRDDGTEHCKRIYDGN